MTFDLTVLCLSFATESCFDAHVWARTCSYWFKLSRVDESLLQKRCKWCQIAAGCRKCCLARTRCALCQGRLASAPKDFPFNAISNSFLQIAVSRGYLPLVKFGLERGKLCDRKNLSGIALFRKRLEIIQYFVDIAFADFNFSDMISAVQIGFVTFLDYCLTQLALQKISYLTDAQWHNLIEQGRHNTDSVQWLAENVPAHMSSHAISLIQGSRKFSVKLWLDQVQSGAIVLTKGPFARHH